MQIRAREICFSGRVEGKEKTVLRGDYSSVFAKKTLSQLGVSTCTLLANDDLRRRVLKGKPVSREAYYAETFDKRAWTAMLTAYIVLLSFGAKRMF